MNADASRAVLNAQFIPTGREIALSAMSAMIGGALALSLATLLHGLPRDLAYILGTALLGVILIDGTWFIATAPVLRPLLQDPATIEGVSLLPNPARFLLLRMQQADMGGTYHLLRLAMQCGLVIFVLLDSRIAGAASPMERMEAAALCAASWFLTRVFLYRRVLKLEETRLAKAVSAHAFRALGALRKRVGAPSLATPAPLDSELLKLFWVVPLSTVFMNSPAAGFTPSAISVFVATHFVFPAVFPLGVAIRIPMTRRTEEMAEACTNHVVSELGRLVAEERRARP